MIVQYRTLCTLRFVHAYYGGPCPSFELVVPKESARAAGRHRLLFKMLGGTLHVLYEADESGAPRVPARSVKLRFGLKVVDSTFVNVTKPVAAFATGFAYYANGTDPSSLDAPRSARLLGSQVLSHALSSTERPLTARLRDENGSLAATVRLDELDARTAVAFPLHTLESGRITLQEAYDAGELRSFEYYFHPELAAEGVFAAVDLQVPQDSFTAPLDFEASFDAREERLNYYVLVDRHTDAEFNALRVSDADDTRGISFSRIPAEALGASDLSPALLASGDTRLVLFRSDNPVPRSRMARRRLQLSRNDEVLIAHLPQPGESRSDANLIIHISK